MRINITSILAGAGMAAGLLTGSAFVGDDEPLGVYDTPGGTLTVFQDHSATWEPTEGVILGICEMDDTNATTGAWHEPLYGCAPMVAPDGKPVGQVFPDDNSGFYPESAYGYDGEDRVFTLHN